MMKTEMTLLFGMEEVSKIKAFLLWMHKNNIDSVIPFFVYQIGRDGKIPHWTDGKRLYNVSELVEKYEKQTRREA